MRAPGMTWFRLPLFIWSTYATSLVIMLGTPVITKGAPTNDLDLVLAYRADLSKGHVTGAISGVDIELTATAFSAAVVVDLSNDTSVGFDVNLDPGTVPIAFKVPFDPATINPDGNYVVTAAIFDASNRWANQTGVPVITNGNAVSGVTVPVSPLGETDTSDDDGLSLLGIILGVLGIGALIAAIVIFMRSRRPTEPGGPTGAGSSGGPDSSGPAAVVGSTDAAGSAGPTSPSGPSGTGG
jgi:hypothetical protein